MSKNVLILVLLCLILASANLTQKVSASSPKLGIDPLLVERAVTPGNSTSYIVNVQNEDRFQSITLGVAVADLYENINGVYNLIPAGTSNYSLAEWVTFDPEILVIPPASSRQVRVTVTVPRGMFGGRYGAIVLSSVDDQSGGASAPFGFRMASFLELEIVGGAVRREAYISDFTIQPSSALPSIKQRIGDHGIVYSAEVSNTGNIHIIARGSLMIQTAEGRTVARYPMGGGRGIILPENTVALRSVTGQNLPPGEYVARAIIEYGGRRPAVTEVDFSISEQDIDMRAQSTAPLSRFVVEPEQVDIAVRPGAFSSTILELTNRGSEAIEVDSRILPLEFSIYGEFLPEQERGSAPDWITVTPSTFTIAPGRTQRIRLSLRPPREADGGYYGDLLFVSQGDGGTTEIGSNILVFVGNEISKLGRVDIIDIQQHPDYINFDASFTNEGNFHVNVAVDFVLRQVFARYEEEETGRIVPRRTEPLTSITLPTSANPVLPNTSRAFSFQIPTTLAVGTYELAIRVDYGGNEPAVIELPFSIEGGDDLDE